MNLKEKIRNLVSQFKLITKEEVNLIVEKTVVKEFKKGEVLLREGQIPTKCYMVVEGCVREYLIKDGDEKSTAFFTEGDTFTPHTPDSKPSIHYWECTEDCILTISNKNFEEEIRQALPRLDAIFQEIAIGKINKAKPHLINRVPHYQLASYLGIKPQSLSRIRKRVLDSKNI